MYVSYMRSNNSSVVRMFFSICFHFLFCAIQIILYKRATFRIKRSNGSPLFWGAHLMLMLELHLLYEYTLVVSHFHSLKVHFTRFSRLKVGWDPNSAGPTRQKLFTCDQVKGICTVEKKNYFRINHSMTTVNEIQC